MPYPVISARRMAYDIDGTEIGYNQNEAGDIAGLLNNGVTSWLSSTAKTNLNKESRSQIWGGTYGGAAGFWFFFPELREITNIAFLFPDGGTNLSYLTIQGSNNTTNGLDGVWESAVFTSPGGNGNVFFWRSSITALSFSEPKKCIRVLIDSNSAVNDARVCAIHIFGQKAAGQTPDDIIFCDSAGNEMTALTDWGDVPEGTTQYKSFYLKNVSSKQANGVNIQLNHSDFAISTDQATWVSVIDITSLGAGQISAPIYIRLLLGPPLLTLGPKSARTIVTTASWT